MSAPSVPEVLFLCVHNAGRSQMAAAILSARAGDRVIVPFGRLRSGRGAQPGRRRRHGGVGHGHLGEKPKKLTDEMAQRADVIVTMGCGDACPVYPGKRYVDWELPDPAGRPVEDVRPIRDDIAERVDALVADLLGPA